MVPGDIEAPARTSELAVDAVGRREESAKGLMPVLSPQAARVNAVTRMPGQADKCLGPVELLPLRRSAGSGLPQSPHQWMQTGGIQRTPNGECLRYSFRYLV